MDDCPICGQPIEVIVRYFADDPFIDGRNYDLVCFTCASIPKTWEEVDGEIIWYGTRSPNRLASVEDMMSDGWTKREAEISLKAIKRLLKNPKFVLVSDMNFNVFDSLFLGEERLFELTGT